MFSKGQLIFAACFVVAFGIVLFITYRKDRKGYHKIHYKKSAMVVGLLLLAIIVGFIALRIIIH